MSFQIFPKIFSIHQAKIIKKVNKSARHLCLLFMLFLILTSLLKSVLYLQIIST